MLNSNLNNNNILTLKNKDQFFIIDYSPKNVNEKINFSLQPNEIINVYIYIIANNCKKHYEIICNHKHSSKFNIYIKALTNNKANVLMNVKNLVKQNIANVKINQDIQGITFDDESRINVTPSMLIGNNKIIANHSINIGNINPDALFYLMSRGLNKQKAIEILIKSMFNDLNVNSSKQHLNIYNNVLKQVNELIHYEK